MLTIAGHSSTFLPELVGALEGISRRLGGSRPLEEISRAGSTAFYKQASTSILTGMMSALVGCSSEEDPSADTSFESTVFAACHNK